MMAAPTLPPLLPPDESGIPPELKAMARWAPWEARWNAKRNKYDKIPHSVIRPELRISTAHPDRWAGFASAWAVYQAKGLAGVGFCLTGQKQVTGADLDRCVKDGVVAPWALEVVKKLNSYTEISPSGNGLRIFMLGTVERDWTNHEVGIEVYAGNEARFLTVTGVPLAGAPRSMRQVDAAVMAELEARYAKERTKAEVTPIMGFDLQDELTLPDLDKLALPDKVLRFLQKGEHAGDRSGVLHAAGVALYCCGLADDTVYSILAHNPYAMEVALDHRGQDPDRALAYLQAEHCRKAKAKAAGAVAGVDEFDVVASEGGTGAGGWPSLRRDKEGRILALLDNVVKSLDCVPMCGMELAYDAFRDEIMYARKAGQWQAFKDGHYVALRLVLERRGFKSISRHLIQDAVLLVAERAAFDSAQAWLEGLAWDGQHRMDGFLEVYFGAEDSAYVRSVSAYLWTALAGRVLQPGVKADMVPILIGEQGSVKSASIAAMVPSPDHVTEVSLHDDDATQARKMRGRLLAEISELSGLHTRELEAIKAFVTRTHERWVPKYKEMAVQYARRTVFIGTTNQEEFLADDTGNRRWLPVRVARADVAAIAADREQLWAEARLRFEVSGVEWWDAEKRALGVHEEHTIHDNWGEAIAEWLGLPDVLSGDKPGDRRFLRIHEVARGALRLEDKQIGMREEKRIGNSLRDCGYVRVRRRLEGARGWVWVQKNSDLALSTNRCWSP